MTPHDDDHLWAGDWRSTAPEAPTQAYPAPAPEDEPTAIHAGAAATAVRPPRRAPWVAAGAAGTAAVVAVTLALSGGLDGGGTATRTVTTALPSAAARSPAAAGTVARVYSSAAPAVVSIKTSEGSGTGFLYRSDGTIVTNAHVVGSATTVQVQFGEDGDPVTGRVQGTDPSTDLAVVKIDASAASGVTPLQLADDKTVAVGDQVVAIGNPFGLDRTATAGIVSATGRSITAPNGFAIGDAIQTDAPINPGNSGGPLLDANGRVIGVNSQIATSGAGGGNVGVGFAVPSDTVRAIVPQLLNGGSVRHPYLGVSTADAANGGAQVGAVSSGSPAATAGIRQGDVIVEIDGTAVATADDVSGAIADNHPGDRVSVTVERDGQRQTLQVTLGDRPDEATP